MKAEIYTRADCGHCVRAKKLLDHNKIEYKEYVISLGYDEEPLTENVQYVTKEQLKERVPHAKTIPQIFLDGNYIGGADELMEFFSKK